MCVFKLSQTRTIFSAPVCPEGQRKMIGPLASSIFFWVSFMTGIAIIMRRTVRTLATGAMQMSSQLILTKSTIQSIMALMSIIY